MGIKSKQFRRAFTERIVELARRHPTVQIELAMADAIGLIGMVQLALRHPGNVSQTAYRMRRILLPEIIAALSANDTVIQRGLCAGFDPHCDMEANT